MKIFVTALFLLMSITAFAEDLVCMTITLDKVPTAVVIQKPKKDGPLMQSFVKIMKLYYSKTIPKQFDMNEWMQDTAGNFMYKETKNTNDDGLTKKIITLGGGRSGDMILTLTKNSEDGFSGKIHGSFISIQEDGSHVECHSIN